MEGRFYPAKTPASQPETIVTTRNLSLPAAETGSRLDLIMLRCTVALAAMAARRAEPSRQRGSKFLSSSGIARSHPQMTTFEGSALSACTARFRSLLLLMDSSQAGAIRTTGLGEALGHSGADHSVPLPVSRVYRRSGVPDCSLFSKPERYSDPSSLFRVRGRSDPPPPSRSSGACVGPNGI
jgi:hypothetical protein